MDINQTPSPLLHRISFIYLCLFLGICLPILTSCNRQSQKSGSDEKEQEPTVTSEVVASTQTPLPTAAPLPTETPTLTPTITPTATPVSKYGNPYVVYNYDDEDLNQIGMAIIDEDPVAFWSLTKGDELAANPVFSPDGKWLAYTLFNKKTYEWKLMSLNIDTGSTSVLGFLGYTSVNNLCWKSDQNHLVWVEIRSEPLANFMYQLDISTGDVTTLTDESDAWNASPSCSPENGQLAFISNRQGHGNYNIWVIDSGGTNLLQLTNTTELENTAPGWSPDGSEIIFYRAQPRYFNSQSEENEKYGPSGLWAVKADGSGERLIVEIHNIQTITRTPPAWSPDGQYIAFVSSSDEALNVEIVRIATGEIIWTSDMPGWKTDLSWSSNSMYFIFSNHEDTIQRIFLVSLENLEAVPLLPFEGNWDGMFAP